MSISYDMLEDQKEELVQTILDNEDEIVQNLIERVYAVNSFYELNEVESFIKEVL